MTWRRATPRPLGGFSIAISFVGEQVVLAVRGDIDLLIAPEVGAVLDAVIDRGHVAVVLDLAECEFMDASGLGVIATRAARLKRAGGVLVIASPSPLVIRLLDITGLIGVVQVEQSAQAPGHLGPEQSTSSADAAPNGETAGLVPHLRSVTAVPADTDVVDGALRLVVALAKATVEGADGVSVSLRRHGRLATVAASDQTISDMDADQYATGEGPCVAASVEGRWFHVESLEDETRWPAFTEKAQTLGIGAILSSPLLTEDRPVGALNIYSRTAGAFAAKEQELAAIFATEASVILRDAGLGVSDEQLAERLATSLRTRQTIALATGILMDREGISEVDAYTLLRNFSQTTSRPLAERAAEVVDSIRQSHRESPQSHDGSDG